MAQAKGSSIISPRLVSINQHTGRRFFDNKAQVAGVFAVVGLVGLVGLIVLITNVIRRRRAKKFDEEIEKAAAEAAAAPAPVFLDDDGDDGRYRPGGGYGGYDRGGYTGGAQYSDASSHGTYSQPPMSTGPHSEAYNMRDIGQGGPGPAAVRPGELYNPFDASTTGAAAGAAGVGVARARSTGAFAAGLSEGAAPYPAFAGPGYYQQQQQQPQPHPGYPTYGSQGYTTGVQRGLSLNHNEYPQQPRGYPPQQSPPQPDLARNASQATATSYSAYSVASAPSLSGSTGLQPYATSPPPVPQPSTAQHAPQHPEDDMEDAYGGYEDDDVEVPERPRVLKVRRSAFSLLRC